MHAIGKDVAAARRSAGLTQTDLARRIGTTQPAVARLESGRLEPSVRTLCRLADALGVTFEIAPGRGLSAQSRRPAVTLRELQARRDEILRAAAAQGARNVGVFGSVARDESGLESDVDILVDLEPGRTLMDIGALQLNLEDLLSRPVHVTTLPRTPPREDRDVIERIRREAIAL